MQGKSIDSSPYVRVLESTSLYVHAYASCLVLHFFCNIEHLLPSPCLVGLSTFVASPSMKLDMSMLDVCQKHGLLQGS